MIKKISRNENRKRRHIRVRKKVFGTMEKPRLVVFKSLKHIYAQVVDDVRGKTLFAANTIQKDVKNGITGEMSNLEIARLVGKMLAKKAKETGIEKVVFDKAGYKYHGRIAALADGAREGGLDF